MSVGGKTRANGVATFAEAFTQRLSLSRPPVFTPLKRLRQLMTGFSGFSAAILGSEVHARPWSHARSRSAVALFRYVRVDAIKLGYFRDKT